MSTIQTNSITDAAGTGAPDFPNGIEVSAGNVLIGTNTSVSNNRLVINQASGDGANSGFLMQRNGAAGTSFKIDIDSSDVANFRRGVTNAMSIDSSGNVGIGTDNPIGKLTVLMDTASLTFGNLSTDIAQIGTSAAADTIAFGQFTGGGAAFTERARIDSSGNLLVGGTSANPATAGGNPAQSALAANGQILAAATSQAVLELNRTSTDGTIINFRQAATVEGSISVSGTTVSYNGGHLSRWAQFTDNSRPDLLKGTVMSNLDQMSVWGDEDNEQLNCVQVSAVDGDSNVAGVFVAWDSTDDGYNDILLAMTGDMVIRIAAGTTVQRGDLLMSAGDGTAKPQDDDIVRAKTIAKVTSTHVSHNYADGSYAVPCVLMAC